MVDHGCWNSHSRASWVTSFALNGSAQKWRCPSMLGLMTLKSFWSNALHTCETSVEQLDSIPPPSKWMVLAWHPGYGKTVDLTPRAFKRVHLIVACNRSRFKFSMGTITIPCWWPDLFYTEFNFIARPYNSHVERFYIDRVQSGAPSQRLRYTKSIGGWGITRRPRQSLRRDGATTGTSST